MIVNSTIPLAALHSVLKLATGRACELNAGIIVLTSLCAAYYFQGLPH